MADSSQLPMRKAPNTAMLTSTSMDMTLTRNACTAWMRMGSTPIIDAMMNAAA